MGAPPGVPHRIAPLADRKAKLAAVKRDYPSTQFGVGAWYRVLSFDDGLFNRILGDVARFTRLQIDRGRLHLDDTGREITEGDG